MKFPKQFFQATREYNTYEKHVNAPYLRADFRFDEGKKYYVTVSGLGFYDLFINGKKITKGLLAPYISNPDDLVYFDRYEITALIDPADETKKGTKRMRTSAAGSKPRPPPSCSTICAAAAFMTQRWNSAAGTSRALTTAAGSPCCRRKCRAANSACATPTRF